MVQLFVSIDLQITQINLQFIKCKFEFESFIVNCYLQVYNLALHG